MRLHKFIVLLLSAGIAISGCSEQGNNNSSTPDVPPQTIVVGEFRDQQQDGPVTYYFAEIYNPAFASIGSVYAPSKTRPSEMAKSIGAVVAINGDFFGYRDSGIIIRGGHTIRNKPARDGMGFTRDGRMLVYDEKEMSIETLIDIGVVNTFSFGPILMRNGKVENGLNSYYEVDQGRSINGRNPRTAVCQTIDGVTMFIVVDGRRSGHSIGLDLQPLAELMKNIGCYTAYNLDGGGSSAFIYNGQVMNRPSDTSGERPVTDILYVVDQDYYVRDGHS